MMDVRETWKFFEFVAIGGFWILKIVLKFAELLQVADLKVF